MTEHDDQTIPSAGWPDVAYEPPTVTELGGLAELTLGGIGGAVPDGHGTSGDEGSI